MLAALIDLMFERGELAHTDAVGAARAAHARDLAAGLARAGPAAAGSSTGAASVWTQIGGFFSLMAVVTFGGAYAVLAYVAQAAVESFGWLRAAARWSTASASPRPRRAR